MYAKFTSNSNLGKIFEKKKIRWISFITCCGGYILIRSKWFQSTKSLELPGTLPPGPHQGFALDPKGGINIPQSPAEIGENVYIIYIIKQGKCLYNLYWWPNLDPKLNTKYSRFDLINQWIEMISSVTNGYQRWVWAGFWWRLDRSGSGCLRMCSMFNGPE